MKYRIFGVKPRLVPKSVEELLRWWSQRAAELANEVPNSWQVRKPEKWKLVRTSAVARSYFPLLSRSLRFAFKKSSLLTCKVNRLSDARERLLEGVILREKLQAKLVESKFLDQDVLRFVT